MAKKENNKESEWTPLLAHLVEVVDWALDIACKLADGDEDEIEQIENVRDFVHGWLEGRRAEIPVSELLTTIAIIFAHIELDLGIDSVSLLAPMRTMLATPSFLPALLRCPGIGHESQPTIVIKRFPRRRNSGNAFSHLAA